MMNNDRYKIIAADEGRGSSLYSLTSGLTAVIEGNPLILQNNKVVMDRVNQLNNTVVSTLDIGPNQGDIPITSEGVLALKSIEGQDWEELVQDPDPEKYEVYYNYLDGTDKRETYKVIDSFINKTEEVSEGADLDENAKFQLSDIVSNCKDLKNILSHKKYPLMLNGDYDHLRRIGELVIALDKYQKEKSLNENERDKRAVPDNNELLIPEGGLSTLIVNEKSYYEELGISEGDMELTTENGETIYEVLKTHDLSALSLITRKEYSELQDLIKFVRTQEGKDEETKLEIALARFEPVLYGQLGLILDIVNAKIIVSDEELKNFANNLDPRVVDLSKEEKDQLFNKIKNTANGWFFLSPYGKNRWFARVVSTWVKALKLEGFSEPLAKFKVNEINPYLPEDEKTNEKPQFKKMMKYSVDKICDGYCYGSFFIPIHKQESKLIKNLHRLHYGILVRVMSMKNAIKAKYPGIEPPKPITTTTTTTTPKPRKNKFKKPSKDKYIEWIKNFFFLYWKKLFTTNLSHLVKSEEGFWDRDKGYINTFNRIM